MRSVLGLGLFFWACVHAVAATAAATAPAPQSAERPLEIPLEWQESSGLLDTCALHFLTEIPPFLKEPDFRQHRVLRGALGCGVRTHEFIPFAWDHTGNRLYLDLNGNRDLTDDAEAAYAGEYDDGYQRFPRVKLSLGTLSGRHPYLVDLRLGGTGANLRGTCVLRSFWQGRVELGGRPYQIGLVDNPAATTESEATPQFLFRAWDARTEPIRFDPGTPYLVSWPKRAFVAGQGFALGRHYTNQAGSARYLLNLTPTNPRLGELRLSGQYLYRLMLCQADGYAAILDTPGQAEKIPLGTYPTAEVWLRQGMAEAFYIGPLPLTVGADAPVSLALGGPLTNSVVAERRGDDLVLSYRLVGAGNPALTYRMSNDDRSKPPAVTILAGEKQVASGQFAYG